VFSVLSISYSIGAFIGPLVAGYTRDYVSPYYLAFLCLMLALIIVPLSEDRVALDTPPPSHVH